MEMVIRNYRLAAGLSYCIGIDCLDLQSKLMFNKGGEGDLPGRKSRLVHVRCTRAIVLFGTHM